MTEEKTESTGGFMAEKQAEDRVHRDAASPSESSFMFTRHHRAQAVEATFNAHVRRIHDALRRNKATFDETPGHGKSLVLTVSGPSEEDVQEVERLLTRAHHQGRTVGRLDAAREQMVERAMTASRLERESAEALEKSKAARVAKAPAKKRKAAKKR